MKLKRHLQEAFRNITSSKLRSFLAILGILVGTGSVVALISASKAATDNALAQFKTLGTNLLALNIQTDPAAQTMNQVDYFTLDDGIMLQEKIPQIQVAAPYVTTYAPVYFQDRKLDGQIIGATTALQDISKVEIKSGRFVSVLDGRSYFCVIGDQVAKTLKDFGEPNPLGQQIKLGSVYFTVIGILKPWKPNFFMFVDLNQAIITPLETTYLLSKYSQIHDVLFRIKPEADLSTTQTQITNQLSSSLIGENFTFRSPRDIISVMAKQRSTFTALLVMIGAISLLVGGIGVMNIMLVSVVERRREIAIRLAIGAKQKDIRQMFLIEAVSLTSFGGGVGIVIGLLIAMIVGVVSGWGFHFYLLPIFLGFGVSVVVGILSGFYPALKASRLRPIEILQSD